MHTGHNGATQVDGGDAVECILGDLVKRRISASDTHADIVVEHVDASPTSLCGLDHRSESCLVGNVRLEGQTFATRLLCHCDRLLCGGEIVVYCQHLGAFLHEAQNCGAAIAQPFAWRLTSAYYNGDLVLQTHAN